MNDELEEIQNPKSKIQNRTFWWFGCAAVTLIAVFLRFWQLTLKPLHHDEGVNGFFLTRLFREGVYQYDPANYHGPDLYYLSLAFSKIFGLNTVSVRASVALFGVLTVVLTLFLWRYIGRIGALTAALLIALSPGMVFISRYFIHEILFVFFSLGIVAGVLFFIEKRRVGPIAVATMTLLLLVCFLPTVLNLAEFAGDDREWLKWALRISLFAVEAILVFMIMRMLLAWDNGRTVYLLLATASAVLLFATKETAFITIGTMIIAAGCVWLWGRIYRAVFGSPGENELEPVELTWSNFRRNFGDSTNALLIVAAAAFVFIYLGILFFSSFFTYPYGVVGAFEAYAIWAKTGSADHTQNGLWAYLKWGYQLELPIFILSLIGTLIAFLNARHKFAMFTGLWAFGLLAAYSIIPYKTPWLALSFLLPMAIIGGYGINQLAASGRIIEKIAAAVLVIAASGVLAFQTYDLNFVRYDDEEMAYVYAHTRRGFLGLIDKIEHYAEKSKKGRDATIEIVTPEYWPMPWYTNDYPKAAYGGQLKDINSAEMIVASHKQKNEIIPRYQAHYKFAGEFPLRPGVELYLLVRKDLADDDAEELYKLSEQ